MTGGGGDETLWRAPHEQEMGIVIRRDPLAGGFLMTRGPMNCECGEGLRECEARSNP